MSILLRRLCAAVILILCIEHGMVGSAAYVQTHGVTEDQPTAFSTEAAVFNNSADGAGTGAQPTPVVTYNDPGIGPITPGDTPALVCNQPDPATHTLTTENEQVTAASVEVEGNPSPIADTGTQAEGIYIIYIYTRTSWK